MKTPVLFIPGFAGTSAMWDYTITHLNDLIDAQSLVMNADSLHEMVESVVKSCPEQFSIVGHSMGSWVGAAVAAMYPERISKLVLMDGWARSNPDKAADMEKTLKAYQSGLYQETLAQHRPQVFYTNNPDFAKNVEFLKSLHDQMPEDVLLKQWTAMVNDNDIRELLSKIQCPTLVVHGRHDPWFDLEESLFLAQSIHQSQYTIVEDAAHGTPIEQPQATTALLRLFFGNN
ncbi:alpha/beta fold hydrolase [Synechococcus elongatus]|uniref:Alpha/beta hydrolase n=1 Tax=Synechococcus elongatus PCC 11801 TaxID=2219813 RepID=A0AAN1QQH1_SYNEL|nr:alpha/beta hydrolase [Synechococcus elongatus]AZB73610.1 alpha/beta hydrolase [Synechococcus elongatus PCC 11801]